MTTCFPDTYELAGSATSEQSALPGPIQEVTLVTCGSGVHPSYIADFVY